MISNSKDKALSLDSDSLREKLGEADPSVDFRIESERDNHHLKRFAKDQIKQTIPAIRIFALILSGVLTMCFVVMLIRYFCLIWSDLEKISALLFGALKVMGAYFVGVLTPAIFKNKK